MKYAKETSAKEKKSGKQKKVGKILGRIGLSVLFSILLILLLVWSAAFAVAHGPSESMRDMLVVTAMQASATKWVPYLVLTPAQVDAIMSGSAEEQVQIISENELSHRTIKKIVTDSDGKKYEIEVLVNDDGTAVITDEQGESSVVVYDEWKTAIDGIQFITLERSNFKCYMLIIKDPSRIYVGTSGKYAGEAGKRFYEMAEKEGCVALINAGEFNDPGGQGNGGTPNGLTFSHGKCVWDDGTYWKSLIYFDNNNKLRVAENISRTKAEKIGVRDAVCFRLTTGSYSSRLIYEDDKGNVRVSTYKSSGVSQRTAIGQRADGAVIFLVTDGRSSTSIGATYNDVTQIMYEYGAVNAGMLDGGSSSMLYYRDYFDLYGYDKESLGEYQKMGLVNNYVAFTIPRRIPTYFCVAPSSAEGN
ncbi:MAG: phosphodiester glycosidase family protein [Clostridia bacterium]|nr:phosphodiester glycosidase family protein [Clostridia bacterium]